MVRKSSSAWLRVAAAIGMTGALFATALHLFGLRAAWLVALGPAVVVPLGVALIVDREDTPWARAAAIAVAIGSPCGLASLAVGPGAIAASLAGLWCLATIVLALFAVRRLIRRGLAPLEELAIDGGMLCLPAGAVWLFASCAAFPLLGFREPVVLFTAAHFHFAGFAAPLVAGLLGRALDLRRATRAVRRAYAIACSIVLLAIPLVAAGITVGRALEMPAAILLGAGMLTLAALLVRTGASSKQRVAGALLVIAGLSLVLSMALAIAFTTTGSATRGAAAPWISFETMASLHGAANAIGFALSALVAFTLAPPPAHISTREPSWPRFRVRGFIGPDVFDRLGAVDPSREVHGQLESLDAFASPSFDPLRVHDAVRDFYERSGRWAMDVVPRWHAPFGVAGRIFVTIARCALGQLELPVEPTRGADDRIETRTFALAPSFDGRESARGYVRAAHAPSGPPRATFVASYAICHGARGALLSPAFPLPLGLVLVAVLRFDDGPEPGSLVLSSRAHADHDPDIEGMYLLAPVLGPIRVPIDESITVWPTEEGAAARHEVRALGLRVFTFDYALVPLDPSPGDLLRGARRAVRSGS